MPVSLSRSALIVAVLVIGGSMGALCQGLDDVAVSLALESPSVTLHEPVVVNLSIHNGLANEVSIDLGYDREGALEFSIVQPDGSTITAPRPARHEGISRPAELPLPPGETYWQRLLVNKWYPFSKPGNYRILMRLTTAIRKDAGAPVRTEFSQDLSLLVGARDEQRLARVCEHLAGAAMLTNAETALDAARSLSYVEDVVAVPYLGRITNRGPYAVVTRGVALHGLRRIARSQGLEAVISCLSPEDRKLEAEINAEAP